MKTIPFQIPSNWIWTTIGEIADVVGGGTPRTDNPGNYDSGTIPWITPADLSGYTAKHIAHGERFITERGLRTSSARMLPAGTILFSSRAPVGYVAIASNPVCTNQGFKSFVLRTQGIVPDYVYWWMKGSKELAERLSSGTTFLELSGAKAKQIPIPVAPLEQQKRIVAEIEKQFSRLDEAVVNLKRVKANLKRYKAAVLKAAVEGKLSENWREQHPDVEPANKLLERILAERRAKWKGNGMHKELPTANTSNLPTLPDSWAWCITDGLFSYVTSGSRGWAKHYSVEGALFLRIGNLDHDTIRLDLKDIQRVKPPKGAEGTRTKVEEGDILVSITADVGMIAVAPPSLGEAYINQHVALTRPVLGICREYLAWYLACRDGGQKQFHRLQRGATKVGLGLDPIRAVPVPLPPLAEQQAIVAEVERRLSVIEELEAAVVANLTRADRLRQAILQSAFAGQLIPRVPNEQVNCSSGSNSKRLNHCL